MKTKLSLAVAVILLAITSSINAQTSSFTYQGNLDDGATGANGTYQMRFSLFSAQTGGNPVGSSIEITAVQVENGVFSVSLDFGAAAFDGSNRFLQVEVRRNAGENYVPLNPRQQVKSVPYAVRSATSGNSDQLGGVNSSQYATTSSNAFIQNSTTQQTGNFNIDGTGTANILRAMTQFDIGGQKLISAPGSNTLVGISAGLNNTGGFLNSFFGSDAGRLNTLGERNSFFGSAAGYYNTTGSKNSFFGFETGLNNSTGGFNSFFGNSAGYRNTTGQYNTSIGYNAGVDSENLSYATAIGAQAVVSTSNTIQLGRTSDRTNVSGSFNVLNGRSSPVERGNVNLLTNTGNLNLYMQGGGNNTSGINFGVSSPDNSTSTLFISHYNGTTYQDRVVINPTGTVDIRVLGSGGSTSLCYNVNQEIATCSSSMRYKSNVANFSNGLNIIKKLRPISFRWKEGGMLDFGLVAEEVAEVEPLLTTQNADGQTEGVKYERVGVVLVNAVNEQQTQIEKQEKEIKQQQEVNQTLKQKVEDQQKQIDEVKQIVCSIKPEAEVCRKEQNK